ncbi:MAG TPA: aminotransferase class I/II-fold pyridoxal phosphate-dependent enzyme, partial [Solirubrobacteraceae bacterium]|nr:aminotransferase class I/II-fold pyridoxal phosphate-dependent enzyme [Solirubrobacteraceae bacterium]
AFAACTRQMAAYLLNRARTAIFSTALPPPAVGAALEALRLVREQPALLARLHANARTLREALVAQGLPILSTGQPTMPIVPLVVGDPHAAMGLCEAALAAGVFAQAIRPPTVAPGTSRLRLVATAAHDPADLRTAAATLGAAASRGEATATSDPHTPSP